MQYQNGISDTNDEVITVSQLNKLAKNTLENHLPIFWIKGEISGLKTYSHLYFDLKDEGAKISCVMFAKLAAMVDFPLENGIQIEVRGKVTIYPVNGSYQINVERVRKIGLGALWEAYARLVNKLRDEGLFDSKYKKAIPVFPRAIGVITSKEGAVIRDVVTTLGRRMPNIPVIIYHSAVQGSDASMQLTKAIRTANVRCEVDVLIVCRGGGSMEDLWSFNEEVVAREVFMSKIPVISAVGHETDTTIIDFVADLRAPTPTAAAELVAKSSYEWQELVLGLTFKLTNSFNKLLNYKQQQVDVTYAQLKSVNPVLKIKIQQQRLSELDFKLGNSIARYMAKKSQQVGIINTNLNYLCPDLTIHVRHLEFLNSKLATAMKAFYHNNHTRVNNFFTRLNSINPEAILKRGYAIVRTKDGKIIKSSKGVKHHSRLLIELGDGKISAIADTSFHSEQGELL